MLVYQRVPSLLKGKSAPEPHLSLSWNWLLWLLGGVLHRLSRHGAVHGILGLALLMSPCRTKGRAACPPAHCKEVKLQGMIPKFFFCLDQRTIQQHIAAMGTKLTTFHRGNMVNYTVYVSKAQYAKRSEEKSNTCVFGRHWHLLYHFLAIGS